MKRKIFLWVALGGITVVGLAPYASMGKIGPSVATMTFNIFNPGADEQNTTAFYSNGTAYCAGNLPIYSVEYTGDGQVVGPSTTYGMGSPWTLLSSFSSTSYTNGTSCGTNCLKVVFGSKNTVFTVDTRGTKPLRTIDVNFSQPCGTAQGCPGPAGSPTVFGGSIKTPGLYEVFLDFAYTSMAVCSSTACPEAQPAFAKFWFTDPNDSSVTWRIDWSHLRVLRMSSNTWYFIGDDCDGSQVAGLSKLSGSRTQPKAVLNGYYEIPFFLSASQ